MDTHYIIAYQSTTCIYVEVHTTYMATKAIYTIAGTRLSSIEILLIYAQLGNNNNLSWLLTESFSRPGLS